jgi:hypothetical protein
VRLAILSSGCSPIDLYNWCALLLSVSGTLGELGIVIKRLIFVVFILVVILIVNFLNDFLDLLLKFFLILLILGP